MIQINRTIIKKGQSSHLNTIAVKDQAKVNVVEWVHRKAFFGFEVIKN